jgi:hypothetical protein
MLEGNKVDIKSAVRCTGAKTKYTKSVGYGGGQELQEEREGS